MQSKRRKQPIWRMSTRSWVWRTYLKTMMRLENRGGKRERELKKEMPSLISNSRNSVMILV